MVENVERIMAEEGLPPREATRKAMEQITGAIIGITLVLTAVFVPMAFFPGAVGVIYQQFSLTMVVSILFSGFLALSLTPALCATFLKPIAKGHHDEKRASSAGSTAASTGPRNGYTGLVALASSRRTGRFMVIYLALACRPRLVVHAASDILPAERGPGLPASSTSRARRRRAPTARCDVIEQVENVFKADEAGGRARGRDLGLQLLGCRPERRRSPSSP